LMFLSDLPYFPYLFLDDLIVIPSVRLIVLMG
jgi:hypothetical protein